MTEREMMPCVFCGTPTPMTGTKKCDNCWELDSRINGTAVAVVEKILRASRRVPVLLIPDDGSQVVVSREELHTLRRLLMLVDTYNGMTLPIGMGEEVRELANAARAIVTPEETP